MNPQETPQQVHAAFVDATKPPREPNYSTWERGYWDFIQAGYKTDDIYCVASFIRRDNSRNNRRPGEGWQMTSAKLFSGDHRWFDSILTQAAADKRNHRKEPTPKDKVIQLREHVLNPDEAPVADTSAPAKELLKRAINGL